MLDYGARRKLVNWLDGLRIPQGHPLPEKKLFDTFVRLRSEELVRARPVELRARRAPTVVAKQPCPGTSQPARPAMSVADVAKELNCSLAHVLNLIHGKVPGVPPLPAVKTGRLYRVRRASFDRWMEHCEADQVF